MTSPKVECFVAFMIDAIASWQKKETTKFQIIYQLNYWQTLRSALDIKRSHFSRTARAREMEWDSDREWARDRSGLHKQLANFPFFFSAFAQSAKWSIIDRCIAIVKRSLFRLLFLNFFFSSFPFSFVVCCQFCLVRSFVCRSLTGLAMICWFIVGNPRKRAGFSSSYISKKK